MAASASGLAGPTPVQGLGGRYDLILTFDYENLHTSIEENARLLKERLIAAGLGPRHGKTLHIAHSMGGLVSRWFIEREGGNEIVQHLVLLGTPNGGSPWPAVVDWAVAALSLGLNGLTAIAWPAKVLGSLVSVVEKIDVALDQMHPSSDFLKNLHASADPKVPYTLSQETPRSFLLRLRLKKAGTRTGQSRTRRSRLCDRLRHARGGS